MVIKTDQKVSSPTARRHLPLNALRAFEVAARHCHLRRAARELGVTHGAVSRQVRLLEEGLGVALFERSHNRLELTAPGRRLMQVVGESLDRIAETTLYLDPGAMAGELVVATTPSITTGWLLGMIRGFSRRYPEIELRVTNIEPLQRELPPDVNVAVCFGEPAAGRRAVRELFRERQFPVCSPRLLRLEQPLQAPQDLLGYPLVHDRHRRWERWLALGGLAPGAAVSNLYLHEAFQALHAVREGCGIGLADSIEVADDLRSGNLVRVSDIAVQASHSHYLVTDPPDRLTERGRLFAEHLLRELPETRPVEQAAAP